MCAGTSMGIGMAKTTERYGYAYVNPHFLGGSLRIDPAYWDSLDYTKIRRTGNRIVTEPSMRGSMHGQQCIKCARPVDETFSGLCTACVTAGERAQLDRENRAALARRAVQTNHYRIPPGGGINLGIVSSQEANQTATPAPSKAVEEWPVLYDGNASMWDTMHVQHKV